MFKSTMAKTPQEYLELIEDPERNADITKLDQLIRKTVPNLKPFIISGMIGYGPYQYKSKSGKAGDWATLLLASQKNYISLHLCVMDGKNYLAETEKDKFPKATIGKSCIQFKKLADIDLDNLTELLKKAEKAPKVGAVEG
jgi:hypothetical protein